ncbi:SH3 domain-containing protein [Mycena amicta]|nr:SH3 domain-containing protein [Mycena amicta]
MAAAFSHILTQTRQNVEFLIAHNQISAEDGHAILQRLPNLSGGNTLFQARAIWSYNENAMNPNDLSFRAGDTIEIVGQTNAEWWTGRYNGRQGLFPANYVERLPNLQGPPPSFPSSAYPTQPSYMAPAGPYNGVPAPYQPAYQSPPSASPYNNSYAPPPNGPAPPAGGPPPIPPKGKLSGQLGSTLAHSAVGGVGFGAGSALGSNIINSIF